MEIAARFENCSYAAPYLIEESADSKIKLRISFPAHIPTTQSKNIVKDELISLVRNETKKFKWMIVGPLWIELTWFLDATDRQETDSTGDLDNITKPILDALSGSDGVFVDDSQIKSLYTRWFSKNTSTPEQILEIELSLINEEAVDKEKLFFIQYNGPMHFPVNLNPHDEKELKQIKIIAEAKRAQRKLTNRFSKTFGINVGAMLIAGQKDFHRTRLNGIARQHFFKLPD